MANRKSKSEKEREKIVQDRLQILLSRMLQDDDNKYCVDCDSKGPRWASWNLGVFMCIRCAGIHRNLGVHISKVKSVNLDSWTPHQVASMQLIGNSRGRAIYEAQVSEDFRRPQTDSQLEVFIRAKYEKKKYIAREWVQQIPPEYPVGWDELIDAEKQKRDPRTVLLPPAAVSPTATRSTATSASPTTTSRPHAASTAQLKEVTKVSDALSTDLLGLSVNDDSATKSFDPALDSNSKSSELDFFVSGEPSLAAASNIFNNNNSSPHTSKSESNLFDIDLGMKASSENSTASKMSKDSILALFNQPKPPGPVVQPQQGFLPSTANSSGYMSTDLFAPKVNPFVGIPPSSNFQGGLVGGTGPSLLNNPFLPMAQQQAPSVNTDMNSLFGGLNSGAQFFK